jgi:hypothetical protein
VVAGVVIVTVVGAFEATVAQVLPDAGVVALVVGGDGVEALPVKWERRVLLSIWAIWLASLCSSGESFAL